MERPAAAWTERPKAGNITPVPRVSCATMAPRKNKSKNVRIGISHIYPHTMKPNKVGVPNYYQLCLETRARQVPMGGKRPQEETVPCNPVNNGAVIIRIGFCA